MIPTTRLLTGLILTAIAGFIDALAFIELGGYFASFMSGNTTQLGLAMSGPDNTAVQLLRGQSLVMPLLLIGLFFAGAFFASFIRAYEDHWYSTKVMVLVIILLALILLARQIMGGLYLPMALLAAAMGAQNAIFKPHGAARLGTSFVTGTIFNAASDLALGLQGRVPRYLWLQHMSTWMALVCGAALGAVLYHGLGIWSLSLPIVVLAGMLAVLRFYRFQYSSTE